MAEQIQQNNNGQLSSDIVQMIQNVHQYFNQVEQSVQLNKRKEPDTPMDPEDEQDTKKSKYTH